jgi:hypothetical protein
MTLDVLRPRKDANGAGVVLIVSGAWHVTFNAFVGGTRRVFVADMAGELF